MLCFTLDGRKMSTAVSLQPMSSRERGGQTMVVVVCIASPATLLVTHSFSPCVQQWSEFGLRFSARPKFFAKFDPWSFHAPRTITPACSPPALLINIDACTRRRPLSSILCNFTIKLLLHHHDCGEHKMTGPPYDAQHEELAGYQYLCMQSGVNG